MGQSPFLISQEAPYACPRYSLHVQCIGAQADLMQSAETSHIANAAYRAQGAMVRASRAHNLTHSNEVQH